METMVDWLGEEPDGSRPAVMLVAILAMSNDAESERDPFRRRMRLNEMQTAIQSAKLEIEGFAEGLIFKGGDDEEAGAAA